ncbi:MAG TPA: hypothetical protein VML55_17125, partial [Planctomycetaceae bacterium]|nr:hypothetical protein [Planctomycetaceae bacterium]
YQARYHLGAALLEQTKALPDDSPDRTAALMDAEAWLKQVAGGAPGEPLTWNGQLLLAEASRLRGDPKHAERLLVQIENDKPPREVADRVTAERVRLLLAGGRAPDAAELLADYRRRHTAVPGELQFLNAEALAAMHEVATTGGDRDLSRRLLMALESYVGQAEREVGGYWAYRCQRLAETVRAKERYGPALATLIDRARMLYASGRVDQALAAYASAQSAAGEASQPQTAFELGYTRASIELESGRHAQAAGSFRALAEQFPAAAQAPDAHLLAAWCLGRVYEQTATKENRLAYTQALTEHRDRFADSPTLHDAGWMLGLLEERRLQATAALKLYRTVPPEHRRAPAAEVGIARCHEAILARLRDVLRSTPEADRQREIGSFLESAGQEAVGELTRLAGSFPAPPAPLSLEEAEVGLRLARILLSRPIPDYAHADQRLERIFQSGETLTATAAPAAPSDGSSSPAAAETAGWKPLLRTAAQLRIVSLAGQGEFRRAEDLVRSLSGSRAADVLGILDGLGEVARDAAENTRFHVGQLQLRAAAELEQRRDELSPEEQQQLELCLAEALVAGGQSREGIVRYERIVAAQPRNARVRQRLAEVLVDVCGTRECLDKARQHWRRLESAATPGTPEWMEARYHTARCTVRLGERDDAGKLLAITRLLYPDLGGEVLRARFEALERELNDRR